MPSQIVTQHNFSLYLLCISIIGVFDVYNSIVRLKPNENNKYTTKMDKSQKTKQNKDQGTLYLIYFANFFPNILAILIYYFSKTSYYSLLLPSNISAILGIFLFIIGFLIRQTAIKQLGKFYTYRVSISEDQKIIDTGLYSSIRHPGYTGTFLELTGIALLYNDLIISWFLSLPYLIVILKRIKHEEKVLKEEFGWEYQEYMKRSGMFLPKFIQNNSDITL